MIPMRNKSIYPWIVVSLLWVVALLNYMDRQMLSTMQASMKIDITELNKAEAFGALMAIFLWIYGFMSPIAGMIADRFSRKWLIVGSLFVWSAVTFLMGYAKSYNELYWLRAIMGISEALYIPSALSLIADWHRDKSRSLAIGIHMTGLYVGQAIGGFGATAAAMFSWQSTFQWFGIIGIIYSLILIVLLHENPTHILAKEIETKRNSELKKTTLLAGISILFSSWAFWIILFYFAAPSLPGWATKNWLPTLFAENLNIPSGSIIHYNYRFFFFYRCYFRGYSLGSLGTEKYTRAYLYWSHRLRSNYPSLIIIRIRTQPHCCYRGWTSLRHRFWYF